MTTALDLVSGVVSRQLPPKILLFGLFNSLNRWLGTGRRRYEFERLYTEQADPWDYRSSPYENDKYEQTLAVIRQYRSNDAAALELGCSIGQFSGKLARAFGKVISVDFAEQALAAARNHNRDLTNARFVRSAIQDLDLGQRYDVITCAEVLYYIEPREADLVAKRLSDHLAPGGIIVTVADTASGEPSDSWETLLGERFQTLHQAVINDPARPWRICVFGSCALEQSSVPRPAHHRHLRHGRGRNLADGGVALPPPDRVGNPVRYTSHQRQSRPVR